MCWRPQGVRFPHFPPAHIHIHPWGFWDYLNMIGWVMIPEAGTTIPTCWGTQRFLGTQRALAAILVLADAGGVAMELSKGPSHEPIDLAELISIYERVCFQRLEASPKTPGLWPIRAQHGTCLPPVHHCSRSSASQLDHACSGRKSPPKWSTALPRQSTAKNCHQQLSSLVSTRKGKSRWIYEFGSHLISNLAKMAVCPTHRKSSHMTRKATG